MSIKKLDNRLEKHVNVKFQNIKLNFVLIEGIFIYMWD